LFTFFHSLSGCALCQRHTRPETGELKAEKSKAAKKSAVITQAPTNNVLAAEAVKRHF